MDQCRFWPLPTTVVSRVIGWLDFDETFNVADGEPVSRRDFYTFWARVLNAPEAQFDHRPEPGTANRRIANAAAQEQLGWRPRFASYRDGLIEIP